jgi:hypothetical protein
MADFCRQCSIYHFGHDGRDLAELGKNNPNAPLKEGEVWVVICEGCGPTGVNEDGVCMAPNCLEDHNGK